MTESETPAAHAVSRRRYRNTQSLIAHAEPHFAAAHDAGLMDVYAAPAAGRSVIVGYARKPSRSIVDFVRCSYLGLDNHPAIVKGAQTALAEYQTVHWSCARTRLNFTLAGALEEELSDLFNARVVVYSSVLAANMGALPLWASGYLTGGHKPVMVFDRLAHATLAYHKPAVAEETTVQTIAHNDLSALESICRGEQPVVYVCDGVYSMGGQAPIRELQRLQERYGLYLYIDDAHGISLFGDHGEGFARSRFAGPLGDRTIIAASLGKGFGASGGLIMLGTQRQEFLFRSFAVAHAFSASPNVAALGAAMASAQLHRTSELKDRQAGLRDRIARFDDAIATEQRGAILPIRTITIGEEREAIAVARQLLDVGYYTSAIFFPTVARGAAGIRICPTASHSISDINRLCGALEQVKPLRPEQ